MGALLVVGCLAAASGTASAGYYCNIAVAPMSQCASSSGVGRFTNNIAQYIGAGTVSVCQKETAVPPYAHQLSRTCGNNIAVGYHSDGWSGLGHYEENFVGNNSGYTHTILGGGDIYWGFARQARSSSSSLAEVTGTTIAAEDAPAAARARLGVLREEPTAGRVATLALPSDQISLRSTTKGICLDAAQVGGEITCQDYERTINGELLAASICGPDQPDASVVLYGVAPDGVSSVEVQTAEGAPVGTAAVTSNTFRLQLSTNDAAAAERLQHVGGHGAVLSLGVIPEDLAC
ncbi:hypothetical protein VSS74_01425 [Conexibacter stalactiti]|uniref:Secreted protein n=1 Tax=Conexibacter stalactiti TaxID=1940611 RepID=A0ABU4HI40_9ACTN|nr:hypothetical protein [Conexibacter stalactiti]MEC5033619.1 hypothetical protein [Conexibacter stalactiti]